MDYAYRERWKGEGRGKRKNNLQNMCQLEADNNKIKELTRCFN